MKSLFAKIFIVFILLQGCDSTSVPVKKSKTNSTKHSKKGSKNVVENVVKKRSKWNRVRKR